MNNVLGGGFPTPDENGLPGGEGQDPALEEQVRIILEALAREAEAAGGYYNLIPDADASFVDHMISREAVNYPQMERAELNEMLARNWLGRNRIFDAIVTARGFTATDSFSGTSDNAAEVAALTYSASYVFMDKGVFGSEGGSLNYFKIAGRQGKIPDGVSTGVRVFGKIRVGAPLQLEGAPMESTSRLQRVFVRQVDRTTDGNDILDVSEAVKDGTQMIDAQTLRKALEAEQKRQGLSGPEVGE